MKTAILMATTIATISMTVPVFAQEGPKMDATQKASAIEKLTAEQRQVTQHGGTERPFENAYWNNHEDGIYVDAVSGEPLFSSRDKYDSGTGWPSFTKTIDGAAVQTHEDTRYGMSRVEVKSGGAGSHLGHLFDDGPKDKGGQRFCINSASMRFIPKADLEKEGYGRYKSQFE